MLLFSFRDFGKSLEEKNNFDTKKQKTKMYFPQNFASVRIFKSQSKTISSCNLKRNKNNTVLRLKYIVLVFLFFEENLNSNQTSVQRFFFFFFVRETRLSYRSSTVISENNFAGGGLKLQNKQKLLGSATAIFCDEIKNKKNIEKKYEVKIFPFFNLP